MPVYIYGRVIVLLCCFAYHSR